jgi:hypothetical protein
MHRMQPRSSRLAEFDEDDFEILSKRLHEYYHMTLDEIYELKGTLENCKKSSKEFLLRLRGEGGRKGTQHRSMVQLYAELQTKKKALADTGSAEDVSASIRWISQATLPNFLWQLHACNAQFSTRTT